MPQKDTCILKLRCAWKKIGDWAPVHGTVGEKAHSKQYRGNPVGIGSQKVLPIVSLHFQTKVFNPIHWVHPKEEVNLAIIIDINVNYVKTK